MRVNHGGHREEIKANFSVPSAPGAIGEAVLPTPRLTRIEFWAQTVGPWEVPVFTTINKIDRGGEKPGGGGFGRSKNRSVSKRAGRIGGRAA